MPERTVLLVDGHGLAFRAFFALPELNAPDGTPTNALLGYANMLLRTLEELKPDLAAVVFDAPGPTFRHEAYEAYKEGRQPTPGEFKAQVPLIKEFSRDLGLSVVERAGVEADDVIASTALSAAGKGYRVVVLTADKDILQVLGENLQVMRPVKGVSEFRLWDPESFRDDYGFAPAAMADYLAMVGDSVDNVPGIKGVGDKTARALLAEHGSLEGIYGHLEGMKPGLRKKLEEGRETAYSSRELTRLRLDEPMAEGELRRGEMKREELAAFFGRYALKSLAQRLLGGSAQAAPAPSSPPAAADLREGTLEELLSGDELALGWAGGGDYPQDFSIQEFCLCSPDGLFWRGAAEGPALEKLARWTQRGRVTTSGYKELCAAAPSLLPEPGRVWDARLAHYALHPEVKDRSSYGPSPGETMALWEARERLNPQLLSLGLEGVMADIDTPLCQVLASMERRGVRGDKGQLSDLEEELDHRTGEISTQVDALVGDHVNLNSTKQVAWLLFEKLGYPPVKKIKTGFSTDVSVLEELAALPLSDDGVPRMLLEYREIAKVISGFIQPLLRQTDPVTGSVHTTFEHTVTGTGRLSSRDPNLQNVPTFGNWAGRLRRALKPRGEGNLFLAADYSQVELRILAHICGEERLKEAFAQGRDIHAETAFWIFGGSGEVTPEHRRMAKVVNFGLLYGMGVHGLSQRMGISRDEAAAVIGRYFAAFPRVKDYMENSARDAKERGYTKTLFGRIRPLSEVSTVEGRGPGALERVAVNTPLQGTAADISRIAMVRYHRSAARAGLEAPLVLQVHDSLVVECRPGQEEAVTVLLRESMEGAADLSVPLAVHIKGGATFEDI